MIDPVGLTDYGNIAGQIGGYLDYIAPGSASFKQAYYNCQAGNDLYAAQWALQGLLEFGTAGLTAGLGQYVSIGRCCPPVTKGTATINRHGKDHFSVEITQGSNTTGTHQVVTSLNGSTTRIVGTGNVPPGPVTATRTIDLPNSSAAAARQQEMIGQGNLGPYDRVTNSCVSHVCDILNAGGATTPAPDGSAQARYLLDLLKGSNLK